MLRTACLPVGLTPFTDGQFTMIDPCWEVYQTLVDNVLHYPHSRFDVAEWLPLVG